MSRSKRLDHTRSGANLYKRRLQPWSMTLNMQFELIHYRNLRCPVCPAGIRAVKRKKQEMLVELFEHILDQVDPNLLTASLWA